MKPTKPNSKDPKGFTLIVTLTLMILLTVVAVGLLTLSSISLRASSQGGATATARSNARLALMLAIGELQKTAGPDKRITAPANLMNATAPAGITGVWNSWRPPINSPDYDSAKAGANFLGYLMSNPAPATAPDPKVLATTTGNMQQLVGVKSVGTTNPSLNEISAPLVPISGSKPGIASGAMAYVTLDEGVKGRIDLMPAEEPVGTGESITQVGAPARNGFESVADLDFLNEDRAKLQVSLPKLVSLNQANLKATAKDAIKPYFHDLTVSSASLQTDVANGGLKTDLSVLFDGTYGSPINDPSYSSRYLYSDTNAPFQGASTTSDVQWSLYANYSRLYRRTTANDNAKDGLIATLPSNYAIKKISGGRNKDRYEPDMASLKQPVLMPTVVRVDTVFSLVTRYGSAWGTPAANPYTLHLMYLPIITLHNPYNVRLRVTGLQVEFSNIPVGFEFLVNGNPVNNRGLLPINEFNIDNGQAGKPLGQKTFGMKLSNSLSSSAEVLMGPGETRIFGTPFPPDVSWNNKGQFEDWRYESSLIGDAFIKPGMIAPPNIGVGFDVDWLNPAVRPGIVYLKPTDNIAVRFGPTIPSTVTDNAFVVTIRMRDPATNTNKDVGKTQVFYKDQTRLTTIAAEGVSPRFPTPRTFPATYPSAGKPPITPTDIEEVNATLVKDYTRSRPFALFSVGGKTTQESFTKSRPVVDTGVAFQMATCDFTSADSAGASPLEFSLVPVINGSGAPESGGVKAADGITPVQGFFFGGNGSQRGTPNATFYEIPMAPLQSIAQLRHANGGSLGAAPYVTYTIGESRAHPAVPSTAVFKSTTSGMVLDRSWLANDQLWDKYWFSTLATLQGPAYTGSSSLTQAELAKQFFAGTRNLPNSRNSAYLPGGKNAADAADAAITVSGAQSAAHILTKGGFNVNSTSIPAWTSVLSALATSDVPLAAGTTEKDPAGTPFLRLRQPVKASTVLGKDKLWNSYRVLSKDEIATLAKEIVAEVKARGPFLSMAEFVNRRLGSSTDPFANKGALQAAIDRTGINAIMETNALTVTPAEVAGYGWANKDAVDKNTGAGAPGEVSQGDILSTIGSFVSVRSDTFRVRAFGDARDPGGKVIARAWCEATIQRIPEYVDSTDLPAAVASAPANVNFGRQFKVVSFRWLHPDEV